MKNFIEARFPEDISFGSTGGPAFSTNVITTNNGHEYRNSNWEMPLYRYDVSYGIKNPSQVEKLIHFFNICKGRAIGFRFKDWLDYRISKQQINITTNITDSFQITKRYNIGDHILERTISKPVIGTLEIFHRNKILDPKLYDVDWISGLVKLKTPMNLIELFISCNFDIPVRFDIDRLNILIESPSSFSCTDITILEMRSNQWRKI